MRGNRCTTSACDALAAEQCNATPHRAIPTYPVQYPRATSTIKNPDSTASVEDTGGSRESSCGARGRRQGLAGLRGDAPSEARGADGERAGRRPRVHQAARPRHAETPPRRCGTGSAHPVGRKSLNESDGESHLRVTLPPAASISALAFSASSFFAEGKMVEGAGGICRGAGGRRRGQAAAPVGGGWAWPGFETTRRAKLAARTASGRAAAHGCIKQPGPANTTKPPGPTGDRAAHASGR